eukprot:CAMPEP_0169131682 /NCGR_PEP_ID=MMETSP1015-20121227/38380_1 /TAXON_ID=342587 /ORGANISM="Karlodinium micrum, Strain CCMP2283" /LENGTH=103 /DNA_ID=CAMNT_0009195965 /DNA_START=312 /DNA_END=623 /DNA_ORIENTATION=+
MRRAPSSDGVEVQAVLAILSAPKSDSVSSLIVVAVLKQLLSRLFLLKRLLQSEPSAFNADLTARKASSTTPIVLAASCPMSHDFKRLTVEAGRLVILVLGEDG